MFGCWKICLLSKERTETQEKDESHGNETNGAADMVNGLTEGSIKSKDLQGHLDCVTGLAVASITSLFLSLIYAVSIQ